jgi:hypothetical protein
MRAGARVRSHGQGATIEKVLFADYGTPEGECQPKAPGASTLKQGSCHSDGKVVRKSVRDACVGRVTCKLQASNDAYGEPCYGTTKYLAVSIRCSKGHEEL